MANEVATRLPRIRMRDGGMNARPYPRMSAQRATNVVTRRGCGEGVKPVEPTPPSGAPPPVELNNPDELFGEDIARPTK